MVAYSVNITPKIIVITGDDMSTSENKLDEIDRKLDVLILLLASNVGAGLSLVERAPRCESLRGGRRGRGKEEGSETTNAVNVWRG